MQGAVCRCPGALKAAKLDSASLLNDTEQQLHCQPVAEGVTSLSIYQPSSSQEWPTSLDLWGLT